MQVNLSKFSSLNQSIFKQSRNSLTVSSESIQKPSANILKIQNSNLQAESRNFIKTEVSRSPNKSILGHTGKQSQFISEVESVRESDHLIFQPKVLIMNIIKNTGESAPRQHQTLEVTKTCS